MPSKGTQDFIFRQGCRLVQSWSIIPVGSTTLVSNTSWFLASTQEFCSDQALHWSAQKCQGAKSAKQTSGHQLNI